MIRYQPEKVGVKDWKTEPLMRQSEMGVLDQAILKTQEALLGLQSPEGHWVGELEADVTVTAGYIPLMYFMTGEVDRERAAKIVNFVLSKQGADGSWSTYYGGPGDLSVTVQAYFALKLAGLSADEGCMKRAREFVLAKGGVTKSHVFTKIWLAVFGQFDWKGVPCLPPEVIMLPKWNFFNIYDFASWSRATIVALMVVLTRKPVCAVPQGAGVSELYAEPEGGRNISVGEIRDLFSWRTFFLTADKIFKAYENSPVKPFRAYALRGVERWIASHQESDGSWAGIMLPWVYSLIALKALGRPLDHPVIAKGLRGLDGFLVEEDSTIRLQPATSPVWDTAWAAVALQESGLDCKHPALVKSAQWLLKEKIHVEGDWCVKNRGVRSGCWAFEFDNDLYPDIDDTAVVPRALMAANLGEEDSAKSQAIQDGLDWVLSMQSKDGGWAAFDRNNNKAFLAHIPFSDFMTPLDPTSPDVTAHALELIGALRPDHPAVRKAIDYLKRIQRESGAWYGRWGVNCIYGTALVLASLQVLRERPDQGYILKAVSWLKSWQNTDGGWGETCRTYEDPNCDDEIRPSTASQTAWALIGLIAAGAGASQEVRDGINYLVKAQQPDGTWHEDAYTGTGFPRAFYLRYDLYRIYFPLMALSRYRSSLEGLKDAN